MKAIRLRWSSHEFDCFLFESADRLCKRLMVGFKVIVPNMGCLLCIYHFENPFSFTVLVDLNLHRHPVTREALAQHGMRKCWLVVSGRHSHGHFAWKGKVYRLGSTSRSAIVALAGVPAAFGLDMMVARGQSLANSRRWIVLPAFIHVRHAEHGWRPSNCQATATATA